MADHMTIENDIKEFNPSEEIFHYSIRGHSNSNILEYLETKKNRTNVHNL